MVDVIVVGEWFCFHSNVRGGILLRFGFMLVDDQTTIDVGADVHVVVINLGTLLVLF